ncbi:disulfide bond formation protein B [uncultured Paracoccus sp.]|uniref:disulfide bond formation protein B n=1 Tax=uncultured Paracoccus sp. TaxID=189685 RepID=UPI0025DD6369|nr:disulfide bond formation protein B [uncultured Paracoccus sp.]
MLGLSDRDIGALAGLGSLGLLAAALFFQWLGYAPCELCILQRWPHVAAALIGAAIWYLGWRRWLALLGLLAAITATALAIHHFGVELRWWAGPQHCSGGVGNLTQLSTQDLLTQLQAAPITRCDEVAWRFLGISMAGWNGICSAVLAGAWAVSARGRAPLRGA